MNRRRTVIISGASGGLGQALCRLFLREGYRLILLCRKDREGRLQSLRGDDGEPPLVLEADMTVPDQISAVFEEIRRRGLRPDVLVNNAACQDMSPLEELDASEWDRMMAVNLRAPHLCTRLFASLEPPGEDPEGRSIVNIASIEGENPAVGHSHYDASKAGLIQYSRAAALELGSRKIRVNCVSPGLIDRPGLEEAWPEGVHRYRTSSPLNRLVREEDVAEAALFLCSSAAGGIDGVNLRVDAGVGATPGY